MRKWYKLDNIGTFYALTSGLKTPKVFRYSAVVKDNINKDILQEALNKTIDVFPNFNVNLKRGVYWYYLDEAIKENIVTEENLPICFTIYKNSDDFLYRVSYYKKRINLEVSHILSDGRGSVEFFKLLITNYVNIKYEVEGKYENKHSEEEKAEDSFSKYYKKSESLIDNKGKTFVYKGRKLKNQVEFMECHLELDKVLALAKKYNTSFTCLLVAILIYSFKDELRLAEFNQQIKVDLPVDLRPFFKSSTAMNFFGLTNIKYQFKSKEDTLEEIIDSVKQQFRQKITAENLSKRVNKMVSFEKNWLCRVVPIFIKVPVLNFIDMITTNASTTCLSNIGAIKLDSKVEKYVENISALTATRGFQFTICSFKNDLCIGISNKYVNNDIIKNFCRFFSNEHIEEYINASEVKE